MRHYIVLLSLSSLLPLAQGQSLQPGGVGQPQHWWLLQEAPRQQELQWWNHAASSTDVFAADALTLAWTNDWPAPRLPFAAIPYEIPLSAKALQAATVFTVYQAQNPQQEQAIWAWQLDETYPLILTNYRLADLEQRSYLNFTPAGQGTQLSTYVQQNRKKAMTNGLELTIGKNPESLDLPITDWHGLLAELIVYDRLVSPQERRQVETYLALKYGLTLRGIKGGVDYVNSQGITIWSFSKQSDFHHRLAGIGRDDASGWQQRQSRSTEQPDDLVIALERLASNNLAPFPLIADQSSWIWGDNDESLSWVSPSNQLGPARLQRQWFMEIHTPTPTVQATEVRLEIGRWAPDRQAAEVYWLAIDRSASSDFSAASTDYFPMTQVTEGRFAHFQSVTWDTDGSGNDRFSWLKAPAFCIVADLIQPLCHPRQNGQLTGQVLGGTPPYRYTLTEQNTGAQKEGYLEEPRFTIGDIPAGAYLLEFRDANAQAYAQDFYFAPADAPAVALEPRYSIPPTGQLTLRPTSSGDDENWHWQWSGPANFQANTATVQLSKPGTYQLELDAAGCQNHYTFTLDTDEESRFLEASVYPNPVAKGMPFQWQVYSQQDFPIRYTLSNSEGTTLSRQELKNDRYFSGSEQLREAGTYWLSFQMNEHIQTLKLIVQ